jgi:hypothetical protein
MSSLARAIDTTVEDPALGERLPRTQQLCSLGDRPWSSLADIEPPDRVTLWNRDFRPDP